MRTKRLPSFLRPRVSRRAADSPLLGAPGFLFQGQGPSLTGLHITPQTALTFSAVYASIRVLSEDSATLPLEVFRRKEGGGRTIERDHPVHQRFNVSPDNESNDLNWREAFTAHELGHGNGYAEIDWGTGGEVNALRLLHPSTTKPARSKSGRLIYEVEDGKRSIPASNVLHLAGLGFNGVQGYSPIALHREAIGLGKAAEETAAAFYGNRANPGGVIELAKKLTPEAIANLRAGWEQAHRGVSNSFRIGILEEGHKFSPTTISFEDAQFLALRTFQVIEICRIYRLPPHKLADFSTAHLANVEESNLDYLISGLRPLLVRIEKAINWKLFTDAERRAGYYAKHDMRALLRASSKDRADYYTKLFALGVYTTDEIRELEDLNPVGEPAGRRFVPANMRPLDAPFDPKAPGATNPAPSDPNGDPNAEKGTKS